jgi:nucleotide-binding universal stress UspA family protein
MSWKDLLVQIDGGRPAGSRVDAAIGLARTFGAHLTGLVLINEPVVPGFVMAQIPTDAWDAQVQERRREAESLAERFRTAVSRAGLNVDSRIDSGEDNEIAPIMAMHVRHADLAILGQADPDDAQPGGKTLVGDIALSCGRPVLVVPYIGAGKTLGERIVVAWDGGREATRAVNDALPLLKRARKVSVITINAGTRPGRHGGLAGADISLHLARHGVKVEVQALEVRDIGVGDALLSRLSDEGADLLVMGAYGRSRLRETLLGGVTQQVLATMTVPVLMSH